MASMKTINLWWPVADNLKCKKKLKKYKIYKIYKKIVQVADFKNRPLLSKKKQIVKDSFD